MSIHPRLVIGLGGALAGDDAVGLILAERLAADPRLPADVAVVVGGADLLRLDSSVRGRSRVLLLDAIEALPGETEPLVADHPLAGIDRQSPHAHHLSAVQALELLLLTDPCLAATRFTWFLVPVCADSLSGAMSSRLDALLPAFIDAILACLATP